MELLGKGVEVGLAGFESAERAVFPRGAIGAGLKHPPDGVRGPAKEKN